VLFLCCVLVFFAVRLVFGVFDMLTLKSVSGVYASPPVDSESRTPLLGKVANPKVPRLFELTYPRGLRCPECGSQLHYKLAREVDTGYDDGWGGHWRLFEFRCHNDNYRWLEWM